MTWVPQRLRYDCGIASLAMVLDEPYEAITARIKPHKKFGINRATMIDFLQRGKRKIDVRLAPYGSGLTPFSDAHLLLVSRDAIPYERLQDDVNRDYGYHWVAMDGKGAVLDPSNPGHFRTDTYTTVVSAIGVLKESLPS